MRGAMGRTALFGMEINLVALTSVTQHISKAEAYADRKSVV